MNQSIILFIKRKIHINFLEASYTIRIFHFSLKLS